MEIINRIKLKIGGMPYTISTTEPEEYVLDLAAEIDRQLSAVLERNSALSLNDALILCMMDYADSRRKSEQNADHIREQLTGYLEDAARARMEADELRSEVTRLRRELSSARGQNRQKGQRGAVQEEKEKN
ncbi:MAG: cell division protein ZapA [Provencibacterium sp.]|jgi:cell division protein ZapA (FtsZ GTPase activity inhibitor)|nr:cell division protein ZapA [Provencibacterium sp.]